MSTVRCSVLVPSDPASVFDFVSDSQHRTFWQRDVQRGSEPIPELVAGSVWTEVRKVGSRVLGIRVTITPPH